MTFNYFSTKAAFELAVNAFRKSFSTWPVCLVAMENRIFRKLKSIWPEFYSFDPEIVLHFHFTFKPFPGHAQKRDIVYLFSNRENVRKCDRIWWFFFSRFCLCFCIEEWMKLYICLATKKMWENVFSMVFSRTQPNTRKYFSKHFLKCNQTHENIFLFGNRIFSENTFTRTKRSLSFEAS